MKGKNSGVVRVIEAFLAIFIIFSSLTISASLTVTQKDSSNDELATVGLQALSKLDSDGSLGTYIGNEDWTGLRNALNLVLPVGVSFNLTVYNEQMQQVNAVVISNGNFGSQNVAFIEYVCAAQSSSFHCYIIHLHLAVVT